jgi:hypothetical protein
MGSLAKIRPTESFEITPILPLTMSALFFSGQLCSLASGSLRRKSLTLKS